MAGPFEGVLAALIRQRGVTGSLVVSERDGIVVDAVLQVGVRGDVVAALAASLYRRARLAAGVAGFGETTFMQLEAERGRICAVGRNDLVLVSVADPGANIGLIRMEMLKGLEALA
jgi:predicted regulator of Ras-like GTPase activity (Roadblock/LC7/MglB family)